MRILDLSTTIEMGLASDKPHQAPKIMSLFKISVAGVIVE